MVPGIRHANGGGGTVNEDGLEQLSDCWERGRGRGRGRGDGKE